MSELFIKEHVSLQAYNTLAVPASTRWFVEVGNVDDLRQALHFQQQQRCGLLVLGGGSNIVLANDFSGLTIKMNLTGQGVESETSEHIFLSVAAGENWHDTVMFCVAHNYHGVENLALIPGSMGAAPIQNIGAYGVELTDCLAYVEAIDIMTGKSVTLQNSECEFAYRDSVFKRHLKDQLIITRVVLRLSKQPTWHLTYPALQKALGHIDTQKLTAQQIADTVIHIRQSKLPDPKDIPNAGSFFKNPVVPESTFLTLQKKYPQLVAYAQPGKQYKIAAGWLLDNAGWRGKFINGIAMHSQQALVLTNPNKLTGLELLSFVREVTADIQQRYDITLEIEPQILQ